MGGLLLTTIDNVRVRDSTIWMAVSSAACAVQISSLVSSSFLFLEEISKLLQSQDVFVVTWCSYNEEPCLVLHHKQLYSHPPFTPTSRCKITVTINGEYVVHILLREVESGSILNSPLENIQNLCQKYSPFSTTFKYCPGIGVAEYDEYKAIIRFDIKGVRMTTNSPFYRVDSNMCEMWHEIPKNASAAKREAEELLCRQCVRLKCNLERQVRRTNEESPSKKLKRQSATSRARLAYMSPTSQAKRKGNQKLSKDSMSRKLSHYFAEKIILDEDQNEELSNVMTVIEDKCRKELDDIFTEGELHGVAHRMRDVWESDKKSDMKLFSQNQSQNSKTIMHSYFIIIIYSI